MLTTLLLAGLFDAAPIAPVLATPPASRSVEMTDASATATIWRKYVAEVLDYRMGFAGRLSGDTIVSASVSAAGGLIVDRIVHDDETVTWWLAGGTTPGFASIAATVVTTAGRTIEGKVPMQLLA